MNKILLLLLAAGCGSVVWAQTNTSPAAKEPPQQEIGLHSAHFQYDGNARQLVYYDRVRATNAQGALTCERLTINLPPEGSASSRPTNAVAETNVVIDFVDRGDTNHLTCDKAIYDYRIVGGVTNETFTFTGHATNSSAKAWITGEPLIWDNVTGRFSGANSESHFKQPSSSENSTNAAPFKF
jgi:lipopolysaccharide export system protein LptA